MTNLEFYTNYLTESQCLNHFKSVREEQGVICKGCGGKEHNWNEAKKQYRCNSCGFKTGIKSGTLLENSNLPIRKWYEAFHLVTMSKKPTSAKTLERHLQVHYETAWFLLQKIRIALGKRNRDYTMSGNIEVDEFMLAVMDLSEETNSGEKDRKRERGSNKAKVLVMASFDEKESEDGHRVRYLKNAAMEVIDDFSANSIGNEMTNWIKRYSKVFTDKFKSYMPLKEKFENIDMKKSSGKLAGINLPIAHQQIGNFKADILAIHRCVSQLHLQNYLDEFCYKLNRRFMLDAEYSGKPILENIVNQSISFSW